MAYPQNLQRGLFVASRTLRVALGLVAKFRFGLAQLLIAITGAAWYGFSDKVSPLRYPSPRSLPAVGALIVGGGGLAFLESERLTLRYDRVTG